MKIVRPYIIKHVQLEKPGEEISFPLINQSGYYCLFWWRQIPLGHFFIECNDKPVKKHLDEEILKVIEPTIEFYISQRDFIKGNYKIPFLGKDHPAFANIMDEIFAGSMPLSLPNQVDISVIICTRNRSSYLPRCLESLQNQKCLPLEIIVVDNAPTDDSTRKVVEQYKAVTYCKEPRPGLDIARNAGAYKARADIIAYMDDDVVLHPLWTYSVWETFRKPQIAAMTGLVIASALDTESQQIFEKFWSFNRGYQDKLFSSAFLQKSLAEGPPVWDIGAGANMAFRKSILDKVGYFDERLDVGAAGCSGDSEIWYRILAKGFDIHYSPRAVVFHEHRKELHALKKQIFNYMRGHAAAALIQQTQNEEAGYRKRLYRDLPKYYLQLLAEGFPGYKLRYKTLFSEIRGLISGILFYRKYKTKPSQNN